MIIKKIYSDGSINEIVLADLRNSINESKSVSYEVQEIAGKISYDSIDYFKQSPSVKIEDYQCPIRQFSMQTILLDTAISIDFTILLARTSKEHNYNMAYHCGASCDEQSHKIKIIHSVLSGNYLSGEIKEIISHELVHMYGYIKDTEKSTLLNDKDQRLYERAYILYLNSEPDSIPYKVGYSIYMSFRTEQSAMCNSLYSHMCEHGKDSLFETQEYKDLVFLREVIDEVETNTDKYTEVARNNFHRHLDWFKNLIKKTYKEYNIRIGNIIQEYVDKHIPQTFHRPKLSKRQDII